MTTDLNPVPDATSALPLRLRTADIVMRLSSRVGLAEPELMGLSALVRPGDHVFDIGAAHGMYTIPLARLVGPTGGVHSFEPHPRQQKTLKRVRRAMGAHHVRVNAGAIGSEAGVFTMRLPVKFGLPIYGHAHLVPDLPVGAPTPPKMRQWQTPVYTVDEWCAQNGISSVSFMKVDVEGFEPAVIDGAVKTIESSRPSILLEVEDRHLAKYGRDANEFADELRRRWPDYQMYTWVKGAWAPTATVTLAARNYLFATDAAFARR